MAKSKVTNMEDIDARALHLAWKLRGYVEHAEFLLSMPEGTEEAFRRYELEDGLTENEGPSCELYTLRDDGRPLVPADLVDRKNGREQLSIEQLSKALPIELRQEVLAAVYEWDDYLRAGVDEAWFCLIDDDEPAAREAMLAAIEKAHQACGGLLRRLAARCMAYWRVTTPETIATPEHEPNPRFKSPPCKNCGGKTRVGSSGQLRYIYCKNPDCGHSWPATKA